MKNGSSLGRRLLPFLGVAALLLTLAGARAAQKDPLKAAQLTAAHLAKLDKSGLRIVIPTYVPSGFKLAGVSAKNDGRFSDYAIEYAGPGRRILKVEAASGGIGDLPEGDRSYRIHSPVFGDSALEYYGPEKWKSLGGKKVEQVGGSWMSTSDGGPFYRVWGERLEPKTAVKVAEGLRFLKR